MRRESSRQCREVGEVCRAAGALYLCDVTQAAAKMDMDPDAWGVDLAVLSSHKIYGPKGAGALVAPRDVERSLVAVFPGGGQEHGLRGGTHDTPAISVSVWPRSSQSKDLDLNVAHCPGGSLINLVVSEVCARLPDVEVIAARSSSLEQHS